MVAGVTTAMILAAGFGKRLRPITDTVPKPLVPVGGKTMLDRSLDLAGSAGVARAVVNVHYLADQIIGHCAKRASPAITISDETAGILETGGGVVKALPLLGTDPFLLLNADTFWVEWGRPNLTAMIERFDPAEMDILLMLCRLRDTTGHAGGADFAIGADGRLTRLADKTDPAGVLYAGATIYNPAIFAESAAEPHSLNLYYDRAAAEGRLFGHVMEDGHWFTVGTPEALPAAETKLDSLARQRAD
ncbi:nucleotidyltransferase family protein [Oricola sp.]|uniref:nucleotidyltransferase family protein n=1 Tax=Oricola sp. TaxID=1979950 RepID=UPI0025DEB49F|nr:nucleotidyltransferase family protein [Oricola sp.]MCI5077570.1 nucleotidyltransferase family protein [Oricola sp.]